MNSASPRSLHRLLVELIVSSTAVLVSGCGNNNGGTGNPSNQTNPQVLDGSGTNVESGALTAEIGQMMAPPDDASVGRAMDTGSSVASGDDASSTPDVPTTVLADGGASSDSNAATDDGGSGCPGVPIVPDPAGFVAPGSNPLGIHGSWFVYSDCVDLKGVNCATVTTPTGAGFTNVGGKICTSGRTSSAPGAWGAGIGLELNDGPPQMPYDTVAHSVKGFCFRLSGARIPSTTIRVAFPTQNNPDNVYFQAVSSSGVHTVLFSATAQGSWVTTKTPFDPTRVMLMQFQIPSATTAPVPWDFCVDGVTAITQ
jgi:hypothetical protein